jgi:hypothetical protein
MYVAKLLFLQLFDVREQNYTHPASYYQPIFDVPEDHGTVCTIRPFSCPSVTLCAEPYLNCRREWDGRGFYLLCECCFWLTGHGPCYRHFIQ